MAGRSCVQLDLTVINATRREARLRTASFMCLDCSGCHRRLSCLGAINKMYDHFFHGVTCFHVFPCWLFFKRKHFVDNWNDRALLGKLADFLHRGAAGYHKKILICDLSLACTMCHCADQAVNTASKKYEALIPWSLRQVTSDVHVGVSDIDTTTPPSVMHSKHCLACTQKRLSDNQQ